MSNRNGNTIRKRYLHFHIDCSIIHNSQEVETNSCYERFFPGGSVVKNPSANAEGEGLIPGLDISLGGGNGNPIQYSYLGNSRDREVWWATVHGVAESWT